MGLFDLFKKKSKSCKTVNLKGKTFRNNIEREMYINNDMGYRDTKDHLDYQNNLLSRINNANEKYSVNSNIEALIQEYEYCFIKSNPPCISSQNLYLVDLYLKAGLNDKAWGYLNKLYSADEAPKEKIRFLQAKILKKEKRYSDAIEFYMMGYLLKSEWNNTFQKQMFLKDIKSPANKLKWDDDKKEYLAYIIERQVKKHIYDEVKIRNAFEKALEDFKE